jgi:hypothetical protein
MRLFKINFREGCTIILRKAKRFKFCSINDWFFSIYYQIVTRAVGAVLHMLNPFVLNVNCQCFVQCVNYFLCSLYKFLLLNIFSKLIQINMNLEECCFNLIYDNFNIFRSKRDKYVVNYAFVFWQIIILYWP